MRYIDISTTQNVTIQYELAPLRDRVLAFFIDMVILLIGLAIIMGLIQAFFPTSWIVVMYYLIIVPVFAFYTLSQEIYLNGQTLGKKALGIKVAKLNGREPTISDYVIRWAFRTIDLGPFGSVAAILVSSTPRNQRLGDMLADTVVVKVTNSTKFTLEEILRVNSDDNYQTTYPEVKFFSEEDMLTINLALSRYKRYPNHAHTEVLNQLAYLMKDKLALATPPADNIIFLRTLVSDYVALTR